MVSGADFLDQLAESLGEAEKKLEESYKNSDSEGFNQAKKFILQVQDKISEVVK